MSVGSVGDGNGTVRRLPIVVVLLGLLVAALIVGNGKAGGGQASVASTPSDAASLSGGPARSTAWYCPGPPAAGTGPSQTQLLASAAERVSVANLETRSVDVATTIYPDKGGIVHRLAHVAGRSLASVASDHIATASAMTIEPFASDVAVEATNAGSGFFASAPCATQPATAWHFAAGTTARGVEDWIVLFNPFGDDAVVDMDFFTSSGEAKPEQLQGLTVPRRSRVVVPVHNYVRREAFVATTIDAVAGRIVAQQTVLFGPGSGRSGETRTLGTLKPESEWVFPSGVTSPGTQRIIGISNPGNVDGEVDVQVAPIGDIVIEPVTVKIASRAAAAVQIGGCDTNPPPNCVRVPPRVSYSAVVRATLDVNVVAQDLSTYTGQPPVGAASSFGGASPARTWVFPRSHFGGSKRSRLDLITTAGSTVDASVSFVQQGKVIEPASLQHVTLRPGVPHSIAIDLRPELHGQDATVIVQADHPIVAERTVSKPDGVSRTLGIPER